MQIGKDSGIQITMELSATTPVLMSEVGLNGINKPAHWNSTGQNISHPVVLIEMTCGLSVGSDL